MDFLDVIMVEVKELIEEKKKVDVFIYKYEGFFV